MAGGGGGGDILTKFEWSNHSRFNVLIKRTALTRKLDCFLVDSDRKCHLLDMLFQSPMGPLSPPPTQNNNNNSNKVSKADQQKQMPKTTVSAHQQTPAAQVGTQSQGPPKIEVTASSPPGPANGGVPTSGPRDRVKLNELNAVNKNLKVTVQWPSCKYPCLLAVFTLGTLNRGKICLSFFFNSHQSLCT